MSSFQQATPEWIAQHLPRASKSTLEANSLLPGRPFIDRGATAAEMRAHGISENCVKEALRKGGTVDGDPEALPKKAPRPKGPNQTEREFLAMLERRRELGEFSEVAYAPFKLTLPSGSTYRPDAVAIPAGLAPAFAITIAHLTKLFTAVQGARPLGRAQLDLAEKESLQIVHFFEFKGAYFGRHSAKGERTQEKFLAARAEYPWGKWEFWRKGSKREGGEWRELLAERGR